MCGMTKPILGTESATYKFSAESFQSTHRCKSFSGKLEASSRWVQIKILHFLLVDFLEKWRKKTTEKKKIVLGFYIYMITESLKDVFEYVRISGWLLQNPVGYSFLHLFH